MRGLGVLNRKSITLFLGISHNSKSMEYLRCFFLNSKCITLKLQTIRLGTTETIRNSDIFNI